MKTKFYLQRIVAVCLIFLCLTKNYNATAQTNWDTLPFKDYADYKLQNLNKAYINTGILYDRVLPIAQIDEHPGLPSTNNDTTHTGHFAQAYYEMYHAAYSTAGWIHPDTLDNMIRTTGNNNQHPIGLFYYQFNVVDSNALQDGLLDTLPNGQFTDIPSRSRSPYLTYSSFIASPLLAEGQVIEQGQHEFYLSPQFFLQNQGFTVQQIRIDFGDGQGEWVVNNPFATGNMTTYGILSGGGFLNSIVKNVVNTLIGRIVVVGIDLAGNAIQFGNPFKIFVKQTKQYQPLSFCKGGGQKWVIDADPAALAQVNAQYGNPQIDYKGVKDTAYFYFAGNGSSCNTGVLHKPIVFIDGFDPTNSRGVQQIYEDYINVLATRNGTQVQFGDYMLQQGYDLVILDFKHGNDLLERNAMTLVALLQRLYQIYGSTFTQEITLIGPSMGSLIAQYALAYMEHNNMPHHVKTYVSFDGCHQGANVPIGLQNFVEYLTKRGVLKNIKLIRDGLYNGLAARQMLAHHVSANSSTPAPDALRTTFLQNLSVMGEYPQQCRKVAVINGANTGTLNPNQGSNTDLLNLSLQRKGWKSLWGLCGDNICKEFSWICRTAPSSGTAQVASMWTLSPLFNLLFWVPPGYTNYYGTAIWNNSALDNAPGGRFGTFFGSDPGNIDEGKLTFLLKESLYLITGSRRTSFSQNINNFTMMPSYSSADLRFGTNNSGKNLYMNWSNQYLCGFTPFDYVYAPSSNEQHVFVSQQGSQWFENEVKCDNISLPGFVSTTIAGNDNLCTSEIYSIATCKSSNITWSASPLGIANIIPSGNTATLNKAANGIITLTATINNACGGNTVVTKQITVGTPAAPAYINYSIDPLVACNEVLVSTNYVMGATYTWSFFKQPYNGNNLVQFPNSPASKKLTLTQGSGTYNIGVTADNICGSSNITFISVPITCTTAGVHSIIIKPSTTATASISEDNIAAKAITELEVYPNPATNNFTVAVPLLAGKQQYNNALSLFDMYGKEVKKITLTAQVTTIDISNLSSGTYVVKIFYGKQTVIKKIIKN
ncbi:MAG: T9SS type A sorting domain-containing protein [Chitinophagaceae bacterium]|nr:T9SS type A sorting domain-containing protein [Chitinophagaceae bacterium]